jgi:hypothetical protein
MTLPFVPSAERQAAAKERQSNSPLQLPHAYVSIRRRANTHLSLLSRASHTTLKSLPA